MGSALSLVRLLLPHHWLWRCLTPLARIRQMALDDVTNASRTWAPAEPETDLRAIGRWARGRILEVGAGSGQMTRYLCPQGHVTAVEPVPMLRAAGRQAVPAATWVGYLEHVFDDYFATVVMAHALHHIADRDEMARYVWRKLRPGGVWILLEPRHDWRRVAHLIRSWCHDLRKLPWESYGATHHFITRGEIRHLARVGGFRIQAEMPTPRATWWILVRS